MAYLILATQGQEWERREITGPVVLGRSAECDISIHDISLSRRHCRFTRVGKDWLVIDLASRNGTTVGDERIEERKLKTGDVVRAGKTSITFRNEAFVPARHRPARPPVPPAINRMDDTMAGTIFDLEFEPEPEPVRKPFKAKRPVPQPRPRDPESFATDDLYSMLEQIASSSWDSIYAVNAQPLRKSRLIPQPIIAGQSRMRPTRPTVSIALQASATVESNVQKIQSGVVRTEVTRAIAPPKKPRGRLASLGRWITRVGTIRLF